MFLIFCNLLWIKTVYFSYFFSLYLVMFLMFLIFSVQLASVSRELQTRVVTLNVCTACRVTCVSLVSCVRRNYVLIGNAQLCNVPPSQLEVMALQVRHECQSVPNKISHVLCFTGWTLVIRLFGCYQCNVSIYYWGFQLSTSVGWWGGGRGLHYPACFIRYRDNISWRSFH